MPLDQVHFTEFDRRQYESLFEPGTRLPTRALLIDRIAVSLLQARRVNRFVALLVLSEITSAGVPMPELEVQRVAQTMQARVRPDDTVARAGPLAIVAVCNAVDSYDEAQMIAQRLTQESDIECDVGITCSDDLRNAETLFVAAVDHLSRAQRHAWEGGMEDAARWRDAPLFEDLVAAEVSGSTRHDRLRLVGDLQRAEIVLYDILTSWDPLELVELHARMEVATREHPDTPLIELILLQAAAMKKERS